MKTSNKVTKRDILSAFAFENPEYMNTELQKEADKIHTWVFDQKWSSDDGSLARIKDEKIKAFEKKFNVEVVDMSKEKDFESKSGIWTSKQDSLVKKLDKKYEEDLKSKGIDKHSFEASELWKSGGYKDEMKKIFKKEFGKGGSVSSETQQKIKDLQAVIDEEGIPDKFKEDAKKMIAELEKEVKSEKELKVGDYVKVEGSYGQDHYGKIEFKDSGMPFESQNGYKVTGLGDMMKADQLIKVTKSEYDKATEKSSKDDSSPIKSIKIEWNEGSPDFSGKKFTTWRDFQDALRRVYSNHSGRGYNKVKVHFEWENGKTIVDRIDVGNSGGDFNPDREFIGDYLKKQNGSMYKSSLDKGTRGLVSWIDKEVSKAEKTIEKDIEKKPAKSKPAKKKSPNAGKPNTYLTKMHKLAKEIRKDGEKYSEALKRASAQLKGTDKIKADKNKPKTKKKVILRKKASVSTPKKKKTIVRKKKSTGTPKKKKKTILRKVKQTDRGLKADGNRKALPAGKRISKDGNIYYETRSNRADSSKARTRGKLFKKGGDVSKRLFEDKYATSIKTGKYTYILGGDGRSKPYDEIRTGRILLVETPSRNKMTNSEVVKLQKEAHEIYDVDFVSVNGMNLV